MRLIIAGSRDVALALNHVIAGAAEAKFGGIEEVVSGHSGTVDLAGELYAALVGAKVVRFPYPTDADLVARDLSRGIPRRARGPIRNRWMAEYAAEAGPGRGALLAIWDGKSRGTANMIREARRLGLRVHIVRTGP